MDDYDADDQAGHRGSKDEAAPWDELLARVPEAASAPPAEPAHAASPELNELLARAADGDDANAVEAETVTPDPRRRTRLENLAIVAGVREHFQRQGERVKTPPDMLARKSWGSFALRGVIGSGSYGTVFRAWNPRLEREVALKLLHSTKIPVNGDTLLGEARMLASIRHPNVVMVLDADDVDGCVGVSMEYIKGRTLKDIIGEHGAYSAQEAAVLGLDLCGALAAVHQANLLHRDIKAQNVMRAVGGRIVLMDFGAASLATLGSSRGIGTPLYAAPELLTGGAPSYASDIYSLGVLLYYLASGEFPVTARSIDELRAAHAAGLRRSLLDARPDLPAAFVQAIERATAPDPDRRPGSAGKMAELLERVLGSAAGAYTARADRRIAPANSIAVMPFLDLSPEGSLAFFCDGIAEEITNALTRVPGVRVIAPTSAFRFRGRGGTPGEVAAILKVGTLLEGTVRANGNSLRVVSRLVDAADERVRWSQRFDMDRDDVFAMQDAIADAAVRALGGSFIVSPAAMGVLPVAPSTQNADAYTLYLKGRYYWNRRSETGLHKSASFFEAAIDADPQYAEAYAGLAEAYATLGLYGVLRPQDSMPRALRAARRATELMERLASPVATAACITAVYDWNWKDGGREFERAVELNPAHPAAHHWYAINYLVPLGRFAEAAAELKHAEEADPLSMPIRVSVGMHNYFARRYEDAEREFRQGFELDAGSVLGRVFLGLTLVEMGRCDDAVRELNVAAQLSNSHEAVAALGYAHARAGRADAAREQLAELRAARDARYVSASLLAQVHAALGETAAALDCLEKASDERAPDLAWLRVRPVFDGLRAEGRFGALTGRVGL